MFYKSKTASGFSFAELALVLAIIGVMATLTVPALKKHAAKSEFARGAQKAYFTLNECFEQALLIHGPAYKWKKGSASGYISEHLKLTPQGTTKDGMNYSISCSDTGCNFTVDVNGSTKEPNITGKDIFKYKLTFSKLKTEENEKGTVTDPKGTGRKVDLTDKVIPVDAAQTLMENNWKFTDQLWNK